VETNLLHFWYRSWAVHLDYSESPLSYEYRNSSLLPTFSLSYKFSVDISYVSLSVDTSYVSLSVLLAW